MTRAPAPARAVISADVPTATIRAAADRDSLRHRTATVDGDDGAVDQSEIHAGLRRRRAGEGEGCTES